MPKIIENLENRLLAETEKQIREVGYSTMTIRSVAKACGVGVGTVYNYFSSKDELLATYMLQDWNRCVDAIQAVSTYSDGPLPVARCIYDQLSQFALRHRDLFSDKSALASFAVSFVSYHSKMRNQLAQPLRKFCSSDFAADFIAESLLTWTMAKRSFDEIYGMIETLFDVPHP